MRARKAKPRFQFGLNRGADGLPGGFPTLIHLAWLSENPKVRAVAARWDALPAGEKRNIILEDMCDAAGILRSEFFVNVATTAFELGIDVAGMLAGILETGVALQCLAGTAMATPGRNGLKAREQFFEAERVFGWRG
jgi:hypothetical protein